jgi:hypothetical protein
MTEICHDASSHASRTARISHRTSTPPPVTRDTHARLDTVAREWLRLRTIVDALLRRATAVRDGGTTMAAMHTIAEQQERIDG